MYGSEQREGGFVEHENAQAPQHKTYTAPRLRLYGSVLMLTTGGTGPSSEAGWPGTPGMPGPCYDGMTPGMQTNLKSCV